MGILDLERMFHPKAVAVVGVGEGPDDPGWALVEGLKSGGFEGSVYPVAGPGTERPAEIAGWPTWPGLDALPGKPDLALLTLPPAEIPEAIRACGAVGVGGAAIIAAGGRGRAREDAALETAIRKAGRAAGVRLLGPDCAGLASTGQKLNASLTARLPLPGRTAFVSQSGAIYAALLDLSIREHIGFSHFVSLGAMIDVDFADVIDYLGNDGRVGSILLYMESLRRFRPFMSAARSVSRVKPVVVIKGGRAGFGRAAAGRHTGPILGRDAVYEAAFRRAGIVCAHTFEELFDCAELLSKAPRPSGPRLAVITNGGGPGVLAADAMAAHGLIPAALTAGSLARLEERLPADWSGGNPVDLLADAGPERFRDAAAICLDDAGVDGLMVILAPFRWTRPVETAEALIPLLGEKRRAAFAVWMGGPEVEAAKERLNRAGIPTFDTPERAVRAAADLYRHGRHVEMLREIPPALPDMAVERIRALGMVATALGRGRSALDEVGSKALLAAYGIPVNPTVVADTPDAAWRLAHEMGFPVVLKVQSPDVECRTDVGGVALDLESEFEVYQAFERVVAATRRCAPRARIEGVTVQRMLGRPDIELMMAITRDPGFGPVIHFGTGGLRKGLICDQGLALPPLNRLLARRLMEETAAYAVLNGVNGRSLLDLERLEELLIRLSQMAIDLPDLASVRVDPLMVYGRELVAADARAVLAPSEVAPPLHLCISPYPNRQEAHVKTAGGERLFIRPIRPEDAPLLTGLFETLSPRSVYYRFFAPLKALNPDVLIRLTQIDYDREAALVALPEPERDRFLAVARVIGEPGGRTGEFAVMVGDPWQGRGIGAELLRRCLMIARDRGMNRVWGIVLPENRRMIGLARRLGFSVTPDAESGDLMLRIDLRAEMDLSV
jgi:acetyltransferase